MEKNYYIILGVPHDASDEDIRCAYRKRAKEYHPDHFGDDTEPFLKLQEAYTVLSDPHQKKAYDKRLYRNKITHEPSGEVFVEVVKGRHVEPLSPRAASPKWANVHSVESPVTSFDTFDRLFDLLWARFFHW